MLRPILAVCLLALSLSPALAQKAIITQDVDQPGRNPYQEAQLTNCNAAGDCPLTYGAVPSGRRRVIEWVNCEADVVPGAALIGINLGYQAPTLARAALPFTPIPSMPSRLIANAGVLMYFNAGDQPRIDGLTINGGMLFLLCTISGHDIVSP